MAKLSEKSAKKRLQQLDNEISNLETRITILERERREMVNYLDLNKKQREEVLNASE